MEVTEEEVDEGKYKPRDVEAGCEQKKTEEPRCIQQSSVKVREIFPFLL